VTELHEELRSANLPETRIDEFLSASQEVIRNYQAAVDTLSAVVKKESADPASPESIPSPKDDAEVDTVTSSAPCATRRKPSRRRFSWTRNFSPASGPH
jgi:hypothetical protein